MSYPKDIPKELKGLWKVQYSQRDTFLKGIMHSNIPFINDYKKRPYTTKMGIIDNLQRKGFFNK